MEKTQEEINKDILEKDIMGEQLADDMPDLSPEDLEELAESKDSPWDLPDNPEDVWGEDFGDRKLVPVDTILNKVVTIEGFDKRNGAFGDYYSIYIGGKVVVNSGSESVMQKMDAAVGRGLLPVAGVFVKKELENGRRVYTIINATGTGK